MTYDRNISFEISQKKREELFEMARLCGVSKARFCRAATSYFALTPIKEMKRLCRLFGGTGKDCHYKRPTKIIRVLGYTEKTNGR